LSKKNFEETPSAAAQGSHREVERTALSWKPIDRQRVFSIVPSFLAERIRTKSDLVSIRLRAAPTWTLAHVPDIQGQCTDVQQTKQIGAISVIARSWTPLEDAHVIWAQTIEVCQ
jgi:hypothetical protein